ncbi:hypothetical protein AB4144_31655 [Rhizobiaceae sp. 2RAB30]
MEVSMTTKSSRKATPTCSGQRTNPPGRQRGGSPGSHVPNPHADRTNWRPAETLEDYLQNCCEGLEIYSDRRAAKLLGWSRIEVYRAKLIASLPEDLFDRLIESDPVPSAKALAQIAQALESGTLSREIERCPKCGHVLRVRRTGFDRYREVLASWGNGDEQ